MAIRWRICAILTCGIVSLQASSAATADVYMSEDANGHPVYASHPVGGEFRLLWRDPTVAESVSVPAAEERRWRESPAHQRSRERLEPIIGAAATRYSLDPALLRAVLYVESRFNPQAVSAAGATGVMQLMPLTARRYGVTDRTDPKQSVDAGARYLRDLLARFGGNVALALSAYNAGEGAVERHARRVPPYRETMTYVPEVLARAEGYRDAGAIDAQ